MKEENEKCCICLHSPSSNRIVCCDVCDTWDHMEVIELDHTFTHNTAVYVYHLCIKNIFLDILQYHRYRIKYFSNNNSGEPVVALSNNFALLSKDKMSFTLSKFSINYLKN